VLNVKRIVDDGRQGSIQLHGEQGEGIGLPKCVHFHVARCNARKEHPKSSSRIDRAVKLVPAGDVRQLTDGSCEVASQSGATLTYHINGAGCICRDAPKAPEELCAHRLAAGIYKRAHARLTRSLAALDVPTVPLTQDASHASYTPSGATQPPVTPQGPGRRVERAGGLRSAAGGRAGRIAFATPYQRV
jgi:hypothetical protein